MSDWVTDLYDNTIGAITGSTAREHAAKRAEQAAAFAAQQQREEAALAQQNMQRMWQQQHDVLDPWVRGGIEDMSRYRQLADNPAFGILGREHDRMSADLAAKLAGMGMHNSSFHGDRQALLNSDYLSQARAQQLAAYQPLLNYGASASHQLAGGLAGIGQSGFDTASRARSQAAMFTAQGMSTPQPDPWGDLLRMGVQMAPLLYLGGGGGAGAAAGMAGYGMAQGQQQGRGDYLNQFTGAPGYTPQGGGSYTPPNQNWGFGYDQPQQTSGYGGYSQSNDWRVGP